VQKESYASVKPFNKVQFEEQTEDLAELDPALQIELPNVHTEEDLNREFQLIAKEKNLDLIQRKILRKKLSSILQQNLQKIQEQEMARGAGPADHNPHVPKDHTPTDAKKKILSENFSVKIADLGNGCWRHHHFQPEIQTR